MISNSSRVLNSFQSMNKCCVRSLIWQSIRIWYRIGYDNSSNSLNMIDFNIWEYKEIVTHIIKLEKCKTRFSRFIVWFKIRLFQLCCVEWSKRCWETYSVNIYLESVYLHYRYSWQQIRWHHLKSALHITLAHVLIGYLKMLHNFYFCDTRVSFYGVKI